MFDRVKKNQPPHTYRVRTLCVPDSGSSNRCPSLVCMADDPELRSSIGLAPVGLYVTHYTATSALLFRRHGSLEVVLLMQTGVA